MEASNQEKMRETLLVVRDALDTISAHEDDIEFVRAWIGQTKEAVQEALSAPPRQCDVGTAEDQSKRFRSYCFDMECCRCHLDMVNALCEFAWAQMPYEKKEGGAE